MFIRLARAIAVLCAAAFLVACATPPQPPVPLADDYFSAGKAKTGRVGVLMATLPKPDTGFPGANCLLCIGVANAMHSSLSKEVQTFSTTELLPLPAELVATLQKQGVDAVLLNEPLFVVDLPNTEGDKTNRSRKNYSSIAAKHRVQRLLVVNVTWLGVMRSYSAYVPTDAPRATLTGEVSMIDLSNHALEWYLPLNLSRAADGEWDEGPKFPGLANAYYQVLESGMDMIRKPLAK